MTTTSTENPNFPIQLVEDFDTFIGYLDTNAILLTKTNGYIGRKHLPLIDAQLTVHATATTAYSTQTLYPYIHFLYHLAKSGQLLDTSGRSLRVEPERMRLYAALTPIEKYFFLLETFWIDVNWDALRGERYNQAVANLNDVFSALYTEDAGKSWTLRNAHTKIGQLLSSTVGHWNYFALDFEWLGLWICEEDVERKEQLKTKAYYFTKRLTLTAFGKQIMPILLVSRNIDVWNRALLQENFAFDSRPGASTTRVYVGNMAPGLMDQAERVLTEDQSDQLFLQPFVELFPNDELRETLPRNRQSFMDGRYTFTVAFDKDVWRKITLSAQHTMEELQYAIREAFAFDEDHLYSFFMDGKAWSHSCIVSPMEDDYPVHAADLQIGSLGFVPKQTFLFIYDYGAEWTFHVTVDTIAANEKRLESIVIDDAKGEAPNQNFFDE